MKYLNHRKWQLSFEIEERVKERERDKKRVHIKLTKETSCVAVVDSMYASLNSKLNQNMRTEIVYTQRGQ